MQRFACNFEFTIICSLWSAALRTTITQHQGRVLSPRTFGQVRGKVRDPGVPLTPTPYYLICCHGYTFYLT